MEILDFFCGGGGMQVKGLPPLFLFILSWRRDFSCKGSKILLLDLVVKMALKTNNRTLGDA